MTKKGSQCILNITSTSDGGLRILDIRRREGGRESEVVLHGGVNAAAVASATPPHWSLPAGYEKRGAIAPMAPALTPGENLGLAGNIGPVLQVATVIPRDGTCSWQGVVSSISCARRPRGVVRHISCIGIRTLRDSVTRGYGDHSPLTTSTILEWRRMLRYQ